MTLIMNDFAVLRRFRRNCSLATYLTVIARRVIVRRLGTRTPIPTGMIHEVESLEERPTRIESVEEVEQLLTRLDPKEASIVRMYHLEGKSYQEISTAVGMSEHSIGPVLSRAREKMRKRPDQG